MKKMKGRNGMKKGNALFENELKVYSERNSNKNKGNSFRSGNISGNGYSDSSKTYSNYWIGRDVQNKGKLDKLKKEKEMKEMKEMQRVPKISERSKEIAKQLKSENNKHPIKMDAYLENKKDKISVNDVKLSLIDRLCLNKRLQKKQHEEEMKLKHHLKQIQKTKEDNSDKGNTTDKERDDVLVNLRKRLNEYYYKHKRVHNHGIIYNSTQTYGNINTYANNNCNLVNKQNNQKHKNNNSTSTNNKKQMTKGMEIFLNNKYNVSLSSKPIPNYSKQHLQTH